MIFDQQHTIASPVSLSGIGLHTGVKVTVRLCPAPVNTGIIFKRTDLDSFPIEATTRNVARVSYATSLMKKGVLISTTEHLLSALAASKIDNVYAEIDNLELPILDGSALPFLKLIQQAGVQKQRARRAFAKILKPVEVMEGGKRIAIYPSETCLITYHIAFKHPLIGEQSMDFEPLRGNYEADIAPARTFGFIEEVEMLRKSGLVRGGSLENAVVLTKDGILNPEGLRYPDEFCRHKVLDLLGDFALLGHPWVGHAVAERAGHAMHIALITGLLRDKSAWTLVNSAELAASEPLPVQAEIAAASQA
ncbi:MAG TPA: UDP-3-O-acyl-N-acetylglucosamine deacetylase [Terriglobia bacterium]|nr:UDP-3-O-acyl-N-acetylglucosamine deacetylase [Terriglobia bacterium]